MSDRPVEVDVQSGGQRFNVGSDRVAAKAADEMNELPAGHVIVKAKLAGQVSNLPPGGDAVAPAIVAGDHGLAGRRPEETHHEPDSRALAGAVGAEQADNLSPSHLERK